MMIPWLKRFFRSTSGSLSVETVIVLPILFWSMLATTTFWDAYKTSAVNTRSTYMVADMVSREAQINQPYLNRLQEVFAFLSNSEDRSALRVSFILARDANGRPNPTLEWSKGRFMQGRRDIGDLADRLPTMVVGETLVVVETLQSWTPPYAVGLISHDFEDLAIVRPRFSPLIDWGTGNGGGNGNP